MSKVIFWLISASLGFIILIVLVHFLNLNEKTVTGKDVFWIMLLCASYFVLSAKLEKSLKTNKEATEIVKSLRGKVWEIDKDLLELKLDLEFEKRLKRERDAGERWYGREDNRY